MAYWLDDGFDTWPQVIRAGNSAVGLYARCGAWIARNLTDGHVPAEVAAMYGTPEWAKRLVDAGLWETDGQGYRDVFYLAMNPAAELVRQRKSQAAKRQALVRDPALREAVRMRDKDCCRYCGVAVRWSDRKGAKGGTYDHVDPHGPNTFDNLVVCCRGCNSAKRDRTPDEAGMVLRPALGSNLDTSQIAPRTNPGGFRPPTLPASKEAEGAQERRGPQDNPDWRTQPAFGTPRDPNDAERALRGAAAARANIRKPAAMTPRRDAVAELLAATQPPPDETSEDSPPSPVIPLRSA